MTNFHLVKMNPILEFLKTLDNITNSAYWGEFSHCGSYDLISQALITKPWTGGMGWEVIGEHFGQNLLTSSFNWVLLFMLTTTMRYQCLWWSCLVQVELGTGDEFLVLACDGIWYVSFWFLCILFLSSGNWSTESVCGLGICFWSFLILVLMCLFHSHI